MDTRGWARSVRRSAVTWPVTMFWIVAAAVMAGLAEGMFSWIQAVILLLAFAVFLVACSIKHQVSQVHRLVNGERHELMARLDATTQERDALRVRLTRMEAVDARQAARG